METIFKSVSLGFLLRSVFAGAFFVMAYSVATRCTCAAIDVHTGNLFSFGLTFALVAGVTIYGIHRSALYPWFEWVLNSEWAEKGRKCRARRLISDNVIRNLVRRWDGKAAKADKQSQMRSRVDQITVWADFTHLQYVSAWCIIAGCWTGKFAGHVTHVERRFWFVMIPLLFVISATTSAWRIRSVEEHWAEPATF